jgi:hypothetical protein
MKAQCDVTTSYSSLIGNYGRVKWRLLIHSILASGCATKLPLRAGLGTGDDVELGRSNMADAHEGTQIIGFNPNKVVLAGLCETKASR